MQSCCIAYQIYWFLTILFAIGIAIIIAQAPY